MKIGYTADRSGLISAIEQRELVVRDGCDLCHVYTEDQGVMEAVNSCREGDTLVVHAAAVIGAIKFPNVIKGLAANGADLHILRKGLTISCASGEGVADGLLDIREYTTKHGKKTGPKNRVDQALADKITAYVEEGNTQKAASALYGVHTSLVSRIINHTYIFGEIK